jgi:hypothetical protein
LPLALAQKTMHRLNDLPDETCNGCSKRNWNDEGPGMPRSRQQVPEQIVGLLRLIEVGTANGKTAAYAL